MKSPIKLTQEIITAIKSKDIIVIVGDMGSGKTTEATEIAKTFNKPVKVVIPHHHKVDAKLFDDFGFQKIITDTTSKIIHKVKPILKNSKDCIVIYDDYQSVSERQRKVISDLSIDLRKRNMKLILIYHGEDIPKKYLKRGKCFLIVKSGSGLSAYKIGKYFDKNYIATAGETLCKSIKGFDSVYLEKDGKYLKRDGLSNKVKKGNLKPKGRVKVSKKKLTDTIIREKLTQKETANKFGVSPNLVYKYVRERKETDAEWKKSYEKIKMSKRVATKKSKTAKRLKSDVSLHITTEKLYNLGNKNKRIIVKMNKIQDIGDFPVEIIGDGIYQTFVDVVSNNLIEKVEIFITKAREGSDIRIEMGNEIIEIEVKNYKQTKKLKKLSKSILKAKVVGKNATGRFSPDATQKWLFTCGIGCNEKAKKYLKDNNINYERITHKQLVIGDSERKYRIKKKMEKFVYEELLGMSLPI